MIVELARDLQLLGVPTERGGGAFRVKPWRVVVLFVRFVRLESEARANLAKANCLLGSQWRSFEVF